MEHTPLTPTTVFLPVPVEKELPIKDGFYNVIFSDQGGGNNWLKEGVWIDEIMRGSPSTVTHWLKEQSLYCFSKEELVALLEHGWESALKYANGKLNNFELPTTIQTKKE